jgi:hypothetical protein
MKYIGLFLLIVLHLQAALVKVPLSGVDEKSESASVKIGKIDVGMSGFIVHHITQEHSVIVNSVVVQAFDANSSMAQLKMMPFYLLDNDSVPNVEYKAQVGDTVVFAFGYSRALLIAPSEAIYHRITKSVQTQWIHPDLFATILTYVGHASPIKSDFEKMADATSSGLLFIYLDKNIYTLDMKSFKILHTSAAPLQQKKTKLPFYTRVEKIESSWWDWGEGTHMMKNYTPYYYKLLLKYNPHNKELRKAYEQFKKGKTQ